MVKSEQVYPMNNDRVSATNLELWGLYDIRASAFLNLLYYASRASTWAFWNLLLQVGASIGSLGAVTVFLTLGTDPICKWASAFVGVVSALCAILPAIMGHAEKVNKFEKLHFAYCELFELAKRMALDIRRAGVITDEQVGAVKLLNDLASRLGRTDDTDFKDKLRDKCQNTVLKRFPRESLWYAGADDKESSSSSSTPAETGPDGAYAVKGESDSSTS
jgi:hypothetical protein